MQEGVKSVSEQNYAMEETTLDLKDILRILRRRRGLILGVFLAAVVASVVISWILPPTYEAETTLRIKQSKGLADSLLGSMPLGNAMATKQMMSTYAEILKSRTVVESMMDKVYGDSSERPMYKQMVDRITTLPVRDTEILKVSVTDRNPAKAQQIVNTLVQSFVERMTDLVRSEQRMIRSFIGERLEEAKRELLAAEASLELYKREQQIVAPSEEIKAIIGNLTTINKLKAENSVALSSAQAKLQSAQAQLGEQKPEFVAENQLILQYRSKLADLEVQLVGMLQKYTEKHPEVMALRAAIEETKQRLNAEIARVINAEASSMNPVYQGLLQTRIQAEVEIAAAKAQREAIDRVIAEQEQMLTSLPAKELGLVRVMRDATVAQEIYVMLAKRHEEARISEVMQPTDVQVVDAAVAPDKPIKPNKRLNVMIAAFLGLFAGTGLAFVLEYINKTILNTEDVEYYLGLPVLGTIPDFGIEEEEKGFMDKVKKRYFNNR